MNPGLDKITIKGLKVISIDFQTLKSNANVTISYGHISSPHVFMDGDMPVSSLKIEDNQKFLDLALGTTSGRGNTLLSFNFMCQVPRRQ